MKSDSNGQGSVFPREGETLVPVVEAAAELGLSITPRTALRWCTSGRAGIRLRSTKVTGRRLTTVGELRRWLDGTSEGGSVEPPSASSHEGLRQRTGVTLRRYGLS